MFYEEKIINGVLMCRRDPNGEWEQCSITKMSSDIIALKQQLADLKASLPKVRADAVREYAENCESGMNAVWAIAFADKLEAGNE